MNNICLFISIIFTFSISSAYAQPRSKHTRSRRQVHSPPTKSKPKLRSHLHRTSARKRRSQGQARVIRASHRQQAQRRNQRPQRKVIQQTRSRSPQAVPRRKIVRAKPTSPRRRVVQTTQTNPRSPRRTIVQTTSNQQRTQRVQTRETRRHHRAERRKRIHSRQQQRRVRRHNRRIRRQQRQHRPLPVYVYASTPNIIIDHHHYPTYNDDLFFDHMYHDGARYGVNGDLHDEEVRINRGIERGLITPREARHLNELLWAAYDLEDECIEDGFLSEEEEADLYWAERRLNRAIRWEMRDFEVW